MFGMGFFEIFMVLVVAIIFLGPEKLPQALVDVAKFFKAVKKTLDEAKSSLDKELNLEELKKEALEYKNSFAQSLEEINNEAKLHSIFDETNPAPKQDLQAALNAQSLEDKEKAERGSQKQEQALPQESQPNKAPLKLSSQDISYKSKES